MILIVLVVLFIISFLLALISLKDLKTPSLKKERLKLKKGRVIFYGGEAPRNSK